MPAGNGGSRPSGIAAERIARLGLNRLRQQKPGALVSPNGLSLGLAEATKIDKFRWVSALVWYSRVRVQAGLAVTG